ncbi:MAG: endonuclease/exonuclease/phosphatase family protein [Bacteroidetes bacterium]|uniref:Endonuclease/exonuclease/phosphatase family protein n=1 Tax=Candidatus Cryptobacteroides faecipullorum TaxID=2840764 RepID=A0A9D9NBK4_9BACT|nr:endonuclease/exonuclease/phosphatase family protein [Candidatus Cryptobacteroides faecipullorum]
MTAICMVSALHEACAQNLTVATYNIRNENAGDAKAGNGWEARYPWVCSLIEFEGIDIFGAQEVLDDQLNDMLEALPEYGYAGAGRDDGKKKGEYAPIFYLKDRFKVLDSGWFWLSETPDVPSRGWDAALPRICTWGHFKDKETGRKLWFFNLHMDHIGVRARAEGAALVIERIKEWCGKNETVFLTGDFNVDQKNEIYATFTGSGVLEDSFITAEKKYAPTGTVNGFDPDAMTDSRIDHIFVSPGINVRNYGVLTETYRSETGGDSYKSGNFPEEINLHKYRARTPSDHFPVIIKVQL